MATRKVVIIAIGSDGDINPMIAIARELASLGHDVEFLSNEYFRSKVESVGLKFVAVGDLKTFEKTLQEEGIWHPFRSFQTMWKTLYPTLPQILDELDRRLTPETIMVGSSLAFPARIMQELGRAKLVTVHLSPSILMTPSSPPAGPLGEFPSGAPHALKEIFTGILDHFLVDATCADDLNVLRKKYALPPVQHIFSKWAHSPDRVICMWPEWFAPPQDDWPTNSICAGFPIYQHARTYSLSDETQAFLNAGAPPVVFTAGTAMAQSAKHFQCALEAVRDTSMRAIFVSRFKDQIPAVLPPNIHHTEFEPFDQLLPLAAAVQHHAGIGTSIQTLAAGRPQQLVPFAFDQFDNTVRLQRLGVALASRHYRASAWRRDLTRLLTDKTIAQRCSEVQRLMENEKQSVARAAQAILV